MTQWLYFCADVPGMMHSGGWLTVTDF